MNSPNSDPEPDDDVDGSAVVDGNAGDPAEADSEVADSEVADSETAESDDTGSAAGAESEVTPTPRLPRASGPLPVRLLFWNVFLLKPRPIAGGPGLPSIGEIAAPDVAGRAAEIGRTLFGRHDIMAFAEAFDPKEQRLIFDGWQGRPRMSSVAGPGRSLLGGPLGIASSGLYTVVNRLLMQRVERHQYATRGSYVHDADAFANKGVLMTEVDPGVNAGRLEVFSTHLFYGGWTSSPRGAGELRRRHRIRMAQVAELVAFVAKTHRPQNVVVIVGDFNIPAVDPGYPDGPTAQYDDLMAALAPLGIQDVWAQYGAGPGDTCGAATDSFADQTDPELPGALRDDEIDDEGVPVASELALRRNRIDYLFVQESRPEHTLGIEVGTPRRMAYPRPLDATHRDRLPRLSDHLAVTVRLLPSARNAD